MATRPALSPFPMVQPTPPGGVIDGDTHLYAVRVYYEDTDLSGITYHANYLRWFERARSDLLRLLDIDQRAAIEDGGGAYAVSEINLKYLSTARLDDDVVLEPTCTELGAASSRSKGVRAASPPIGALLSSLSWKTNPYDLSFRLPVRSRAHRA